MACHGFSLAFAAGCHSLRCRVLLERDDFSSNRHPALSFLFEHDLSENRYPLFRIMLW
jgi:hypothetical protein